MRVIKSARKFIRIRYVSLGCLEKKLRQQTLTGKSSFLGAIPVASPAPILTGLSGLSGVPGGDLIALMSSPGLSFVDLLPTPESKFEFKTLNQLLTHVDSTN